MNFVRLVFLVTILQGFIFTLKAQTISYEATALQILNESPEFQYQTYNLESQINSLKTDNNLPDPEISGEYLVLPKDVDNRWALQLAWGLEWPGVYNARGKEAQEKMEAAKARLSAERAARLAEIKDLLLDYVRSQKKLLLLEELSRNNDTIYHLAEAATRGGEMTVLDLNKVKLEYANIRVAKAALLDEKAEVVTQLSQIYGKDCVSLLENMECSFPEIVLPSYQDICNLKNTTPSVRAAAAEAQAARAGLKVSKMEAFPSINFGYKHAFEDDMHFNGAVFGISLPIFSSRGKMKAAKAEILAAEYNEEVLSKGIESEAMAALNRLTTIIEQINEIAPIVEDANYNAALLKAYKGGVISLIEYISDRNYFTNAAVELVNLRHNAAKALAFLERYLPKDECYDN